MKFGMPTLVECDDIFACRDVAVKYGLDFIEINMSFPQYLPNNLDAVALREMTARDHIGFTIHADEMLNPFDFNPVASECYFGVMRDTIRFAITIGAPIINMHLLKGVYVTLPGKVILLTDVYKDKYLSRVKEFIAMCEREIGDAPLKIAIENVDSNPFTTSQLSALELFMESPVFALTLDTGHELCMDYKDAGVFEKYPEKLVHLHLHDSDGKSAHLPLGTARVAISEKLAALRGDTCLIEVKTIAGLEESVEYLKNEQIM